MCAANSQFQNSLQAERNRIAAVVARATERGAAWYPDLDAHGTTARVEKRLGRRHSSILVIRLTDGTTSHIVVAKLARARPMSAPAPHVRERPTVMPPVGAEELARIWYRGLSVSHGHFAALADPRLGSVRPLDLFDDLHAVVMEHMPQPTLRSRVFARSGRGSEAAETETLVEHAGLWLREYHASGEPTDLPPRLPTRADFVTAIEAFARYIADETGQTAVFRSLEEMAGRAAEAHLPESLPLEMAHGDFAPRNVFVGPESRVTGYDAAPRVRAPLYEDLARFVAAMRTGGLGMIGLTRPVGPERLDVLDRRLLAGYYGAASPPVLAIRAFEVLVLLNRLSAVVSRGGSRSLRVRMRAGIVGRFYRRRFLGEVDRLARSLEAAPALR